MRLRPQDIRPTFPSGWRLWPMFVAFIFSFLWYAIRRDKYPHFRLRSLRSVGTMNLIAMRRYSKLGRHYYGTTMRMPRWPSKAFGQMIANGGLNLVPELMHAKHHIDTVIISLTGRCAYACEHCYAHADPNNRDAVPAARWTEVLRQIQDQGASVIVFSGGEPMLRFHDLVSILHSADKNRSDFHLHTSGYGMTRDRAAELHAAGLTAAGIGLDYPDADRHDRFRGQPAAFRCATSAIETLREEGIFTYANVCLQKDLLRSGGLHEYLEFAKQLSVGSIQLLEPKPCGRYGLRDPHHLFTDEDRRIVTAFFAEANQAKRYRDYPPVAYPAYYELPEHFGCMMGGLSHLSIDAAGNVNPCVFVPVSFGNILRDDYGVILRRMREVIAKPVRQGCAAVVLHETLSRHSTEPQRNAIPFETVEEDWRRLFAS